MTLLDANVLIYYLDETAENHAKTLGQLQKLVDEQEQLVTSHHVIEEVLFVISKLSPDADLLKVVTRISKLPGLILAEPSPAIEFARRYAALSQKFGLGINDALLLQLMLDANIVQLFSYDKRFAQQADKLGIKQVA